MHWTGKLKILDSVPLFLILYLTLLTTDTNDFLPQTLTLCSLYLDKNIGIIKFEFDAKTQLLYQI